MTTVPPGDDLRVRLQNLPTPDDADFDFASIELINELSPTVGDLEWFVVQGPDPLRLSALLVCATLAWRNRDFREFRRLLQDHGANFRGHGMLLALQAQACLTTADSTGLRNGLSVAKRANRSLPNRPYILITMADLVLAMADSGLATAKELNLAEAVIAEAIAIKPSYAKYYASQARLKTHVGKYEDALSSVMQAIEREPADGKHFAIRIGDYQVIRTTTVFKQESHNLDEKLASATAGIQRLGDELGGIRSQLIEVMGLLAAVIAFIVTGAQIASKGGVSAVTTMAAAGLAIVLAFASLSFLYGRAQSRLPATVLMLASSVGLVGVYCLVRFGTS